MKPDYDFQDHGFATSVMPMNETACEHLEAHTDGLWKDGVLMVEQRHAPELAASLCRDGFAVELPDGRVVTADDLRGE